MKARPKPEPEVVGLLGLGLDGDDGHHRVTQADGALVVGGSEKTHDRMQKTVVRLTEALKRRGMRIGDLSVDEIADLIQDFQK